MHARLLTWSLRQRRARHLLNAVATGITVAIVVVFVSVLIQFLTFSRAHYSGQLVRILVTPKLVTPGSSTDGLPTTMKTSLEHIEGVTLVQRKLSMIGKHESGATYFITGEEDSGVERNKDFYPLDDAAVDAWKKERPLGAIVTEQTAQDLNLQVGKTAEVSTSFGPMQIKVVAICKGALFAQSIAVHFEYMQQFTKNTDTSGYRVFAPPDSLDHVIKEIATATRSSPMPAQGLDSTRFRASVAKKAATIPVVLGFLGLFLVFTTTLTLANNAAIAIRERRIEVATYRVLGYRAGTIVRLLVTEAVVVGIAGGLVAVGVTYLAMRGGVQLAPKGLLLPTTIDHTAILAGMAIAVIIPLLGALPSAIAAIRVPVVDGLRETA